MPLTGDDRAGGIGGTAGAPYGDGDLDVALRVPTSRLEAAVVWPLLPAVIKVGSRWIDHHAAHWSYHG